MEQKAPRSVSRSFTPKSCQLAKEIDESASVVVSPAEGTEERVLALHTKEAREGD